MKKQQKILIWEVNWLGDVIFSTPFIAVIRKNFPYAYISCVSVAGCKSVLSVNPHIDEVLVFDERGTSKSFVEKIKFVYELKKRKFDMVFLLKSSILRTFICFIAGIPKRIGHIKKGNVFLTHPVKSHIANQHRAEDSLALARKIGIDTENKGLEFYYNLKDRKYVKEFMRNHDVNEDQKIIAVNPGANWMPKRWPAKNWAVLSDMIIEKMDAKVVFTGAAKDVDLYLHIQDMMKNKALSICGKTSIRELGAFFDRSDLVISADSGPLHIALALKKKTIALYGPTDTHVTGMYKKDDIVKIIQKDVKCKIPCYKDDCKKYRCMEAITPEEVFEEIGKLI